MKWSSWNKAHVSREVDVECEHEGEVRDMCPAIMATATIGNSRTIRALTT